jgi:hypothetical protein
MAETFAAVANLARLLSTKELRTSSVGGCAPSNRSRLLTQTSNRSCRCEKDSWRSSPSVPRGAPQCRHLIGVEGGAFSGQSNTMPNASQLMQTILNAGFGTGARSSCDTFMLVILFPKNKGRQTAYDRSTAVHYPLGRRGKILAHTIWFLPSIATKLAR